MPFNSPSSATKRRNTLGTVQATQNASEARGDDGRVGLEVAGVGVEHEAIALVFDARHFRAGEHVHAVDVAHLVDERLREPAVVDRVTVGRPEGEQVLARIAALDDLRFVFGDLLATDGLEFREEVAEALVVVPPFERVDVLVADRQHHLRALAVQFAVGVVRFEVARDHLRTLLDGFGLFEGVVRLDVPEVKRLGVVRVVGVDRRDLVFLLDERDALDVSKLRDSVKQRCPANPAADDD